MNINEVSLLLNAGFTREEILKMIDYPIPADPDPKPDPKPDPVPDPEPTPDPSPDPVPDKTAEMIAELTKTVQNLGNTVKELQKGNARKAEGGKPEKKDSASVINDFFGSP